MAEIGEGVFRCPWKDCRTHHAVTGKRPNRTLPAHLYQGVPCPGGGFAVDKPVRDEAKKMVIRARGVGL